MSKTAKCSKSVFIFLIVFLLLSNPAHATLTCPADPPPGDCDISDQMTSGRVAFTQLTGSYEISGTEEYETNDESPPDVFNNSGTLTLEMVDGADANFLDIACDGTVTGQGKDKISGTINKAISGSPFCTDAGGENLLPPNEMNWNIEISRSYSITGNVTNTGELELELSIDSAEFSVLNDSEIITNFDCEWKEGPGELTSLDVSSDTINIKLSDTDFNPETSSNWNPELTVLDDENWFDNISHRVVLYADWNWVDAFDFYDPAFVSTANLPDDYDYHTYNVMFLQDTVTSELSADYQADPKTPVITDLKLDEEKYYLLDVDWNTSVTVTVDWKESDAIHQIEFTYGSTTETIDATDDETTWNFDAGESGTSIKAKAISQSGDSQEWEINTNKVEVPAWAGVASDWSAGGGIQYNAQLDWPVSLETTENVDTLSLMTGMWGVTASISSEFNISAHSNGSPQNGSLTTNANLNLAGKNFSFDLNGNSSTTLSCDSLTTSGDATAQFSGLNWQKTLNPVTAIPGLDTAVCGLSSALCGVINSVGIKGEADATLSGDGTFMDENDEIKWNAGAIGGSLSAQISANAIPKVLRSLASIGVEGGGSGCINFEFSPDFNMSELGGSVNVGATVSFFGLGVNPSHDWPFGDSCGGAGVASIGDGAGTSFSQSLTTFQTDQAWVPADGQLAMAVSSNYGAAVWSELPVGQNRPSGDIKLRIWDGSDWGVIVGLTDDADADMAPSAEFDRNGNLIIVYQRSTETLPDDVSGIDAFANGLELHYFVYDPAAGSVLNSGQITTNGSNDFGPVMKADSNDNLHLFWQRANGSHIFGNTTDTVSLHTISWDATYQSWTSEMPLADNLSYTMGWSAAAFDDDSMLVSLILDTDEDLATSEDRELFHISKTNGTWGVPVQLTTNLVNDDAPLSAFSSSGAAVILWRQNETVMQLEGDLSGSAEIAFTSLDPVHDEGIGPEFGDGVILKTNAGLTAYWPNSTKVEVSGTTDLNDWTHLGQLSAGAGAQTMHSARLIGVDTFLAYSVREFENDNSNMAENVTPIILSIEGVSDEVFADGFELVD